jgi:protein-tyrosine phosphatase
MSVLDRVVPALRRRAARTLAALRTQRDRLLHPGRHRRVKLRLSRAPRPRRIVVVCHGNICRSPYLEAVLRQSLPDLDVSSVGLMGPGRSVPEHGMTVASRRGLDLSSHRSRVLTPGILRAADLVIVMDAGQSRYLRRTLGVSPDRIVIAGDLDPESADARPIRDPWRQPLGVFESSYARLDRCAAVLAELLHQRVTPVA